MVRHRLLLATFVAAAVTLMSANVASAVGARTQTCSQFALRTGMCHIGVGGDGVTIGVGKTTPGTHPVRPVPGDGSGGDSGGAPAMPVEPVTPCTVIECDFSVIIGGPPAARGPVTIKDLKNFRPTPGIDHMEPDGWMVVGLDTNFYATSPVQTLKGTLLGKTAEVRFTPVSWTWNYGDGTSRTRYSAGDTWKILRIQQFDPTPTSHVYTAKGDYSISLTIDYAAEYRYAGGPWATVAGELALPANPLDLEGTAGDSKTVLVGRDCSANPHGPGC